jgi:hypothetical protein
MEAIEIIGKLYRLRDRLDELSEDDRRVVTDSLARYENGGIPLIRDVPRIAWMQVPGEAAPLNPLLQEGTVSVERKYLKEVIWRFMPLEGLFSLLARKALHFSPLSFMTDPSEGELPQSAFERTTAQLSKNFPEGPAGITAETAVRSLTQHRRDAVSICCWYMGDIDHREMWRDYAPNNGVAIRTTVERLFSSLRKMNDTNIHLARVTYFEPGEEEKYADQAFFGSLFIKNAEPYRKEKELRAVAPNSKYKYGVDIPVSLDVLVERLVLSPELREWAVEALTVAIRKFGLECPIEKSSLAT